MARPHLDEKLIRAAARVTDWHASHHGALIDELAPATPDAGVAAPKPARRARQNGHADTAQPVSNGQETERR